MHITNLVFVIAPRVNAAGRMDDARKAVQLFVEQDYTKALAFAEMLHSDNVDRREADSSITEEALALIQNDGHSKPQNNGCIPGTLAQRRGGHCCQQAD
jgi:single-stranded-DNA-specific exonuclease